MSDLVINLLMLTNQIRTIAWQHPQYTTSSLFESLFKDFDKIMENVMRIQAGRGDKLQDGQINFTVYDYSSLNVEKFVSTIQKFLEEDTLKYIEENDTLLINELNSLKTCFYNFKYSFQKINQ